jgi:hypothetical protein
VNSVTPRLTESQAEPSSPAAAWERASALAVVLDHTSSPNDVAGLGSAWPICVSTWQRQFAPQFPYLVLAATSRGRLNNPTAFFARDTDALCHAAALLGARVAPELILWCNVASVTTWKILAASLAANMPTEGSA